MGGSTGKPRPARGPIRWTTVALAAAVILALPVVFFPVYWWARDALRPSEPEKLRSQADAALKGWSQLLANAPTGQPVVIVGDVTRQVGDWENDVAENNKLALYGGAIELDPHASVTLEADGDVIWQDGSTGKVALLSADQAIESMQAHAPNATCDGCHPLVVTAARLTRALFVTTRGTALVPAWELTLRGTAAKLTQLAIANPAAVETPYWKSVPWGNSGDPAAGVAVRSATSSADGRRLTVRFLGLPTPGQSSCGADYRAEAVESSQAVVVVVSMLPVAGASASASPGSSGGVPASVPCLPTTSRTLEVALASPLGTRAVLEVTGGTPVPVETPALSAARG